MHVVVWETNTNLPFGTVIHPPKLSIHFVTFSMQTRLAERLQNLVNAVPSLTNRVVILTGMAAVLEQCEQAPDLVDSTLKLGSYESRATVSLNLRIPAELDERLTKLIKSHPKLKRRDVAAAGLDWILARCEAANGGLFTPNPALAPS
jgi:hypothetical protein